MLCLNKDKENLFTDAQYIFNVGKYIKLWFGIRLKLIKFRKNTRKKIKNKEPSFSRNMWSTYFPLINECILLNPGCVKGAAVYSYFPVAIRVAFNSIFSEMGATFYPNPRPSETDPWIEKAVFNGSTFRIWHVMFFCFSGFLALGKLLGSLFKES